MRREHLTFAQLVEAMHLATKNLGTYAQRDTMLDIASLYELWAICPSDGFRRSWKLRQNGTHLGTKAPDDFNAIAEYDITYSTKPIHEDPLQQGEWSIEGINQ